MKFISRVSAYDHCRLPLPWFWWTGRNDPTARLHARALRLSHGVKGMPRGGLAYAAAAILHGFRVGRQIVVSWWRLGAAAKTGYGISRWRQGPGLVVAAFRFNLPPSIYYRLRLFRIPRKEWGNVFTHAETTVLLTVLLHSKAAKDRWEKTGWWRFSVVHGLPTPPVLVRMSGNELIFEGTDETTLEAGGDDLFFKPDNSYSGLGGVLLEWDQAAAGWKLSGATTGFVPRGGLTAFFHQQNRRLTSVVQPRLRNAPEIADLAKRALVNVRVMTLREPTGEITVLLAMLRMPAGDQVVSDVIGWTLTVKIDPESGRMGPIETPQLAWGMRDLHPATGCQIAGRVLEPWPQMKALALRAHALVPDMPVVGWDLVDTQHGVMILEANAVWNGLLGQAWGLQPLGGTAWARLMEAELAAAEAGQSAGPR